MRIKLRSNPTASNTAAAGPVGGIGRGQLLRAALGAAALAALSQGAGSKVAEAAYTPGIDWDNIDNSLEVEGGLDVKDFALFVDPTTGRVGIDKNGPSYRLDVWDDDGTRQLRVEGGDYSQGGIQVGNYVSLQCHPTSGNGWRRGLVAEGAYFDVNTGQYQLTNAAWDRAAIEFLNQGAISIKNEFSDRSGTGQMTVSQWDSIERVRIDPYGCVGIGTSVPTKKLEVVGDAKVSAAYFAGSTKIADSGGCFYGP